MAVNKIMLSRKELFEKTKKLWPDEIVFDNHVINGDNILNDIYYQIESTLDSDDHWMQISCWSFHQALEKPTNFANLKIIINEVPFELYEKMMFENLKGDECWKPELDIYRALAVE